MIKLALIGLGNMGKIHLKNIKQLQDEKQCDLCCICDINTTIVNEVSKNYRISGYNSVEAVLNNEDFDAAIIAVNPTEHFKIAKLMIEKNKSILIEKPILISAKETEELYKISKGKDVIISPGFTEAYNSVITGVNKYFKKEGICYIDFYRIGQKSKRNDTSDVDVIQDLMTHDLAVLAQIFDINLTGNVQGNVSAYNSSSKKYDVSSVCLSLKNGIIIRFLCDRRSTVKIRKFSISGEDIYGEFDFMEQNATIMKKGNLETFGENVWYSQNNDTMKIKYSNNPLFDEIKDFIRAVENKTETKVSDKWFEITKNIESIREIVYKQNIYNE